MGMSTDPADYRIDPATATISDLDLDTEEIIHAGARLTEARAAELTEATLTRLGRPSLAGTSGTSPRVTFRVTGPTRAAAEARAAAEGKTVSQLAREALEAYVAT